METRKLGLRDVQATSKPRRLRLLAPLRYLAISGPEKRFYDLYLPVYCAAFMFVVFLLLHPRPLVFGPEGLISVIQSFMIMAVPFLIGALAAVAMGSPGAHLDRRAVGVGFAIDGEVLTLRQFVCYLLGYLCFVGLILFLAVTLAALVQPTLARLLSDDSALLFALQHGGLFVLMLTIASFVITIFWALYFLSDIVNRQH